MAYGLCFNTDASVWEIHGADELEEFNPLWSTLVGLLRAFTDSLLRLNYIPPPAASSKSLGRPANSRFHDFTQSLYTRAAIVLKILSDNRL